MKVDLPQPFGPTSAMRVSMPSSKVEPGEERRCRPAAAPAEAPRCSS